MDTIAVSRCSPVFKSPNAPSFNSSSHAHGTWVYFWTAGTAHSFFHTRMHTRNNSEIGQYKQGQRKCNVVAVSTSVETILGKYSPPHKKLTGCAKYTTRTSISGAVFCLSIIRFHSNASLAKYLDDKPFLVFRLSHDQAHTSM